MKLQVAYRRTPTQKGMAIALAVGLAEFPQEAAPGRDDRSFRYPVQ